ncbi:MAG TPA: 50S ribosomal protein L9, partial [Pirellulales bacterium]|nr:50S ribosomal protein L9 [Pirellulales bacterium]
KRLPRAANGGIELLLIQSVDHLGKQGDVVSVKAGYARNYLLPQGLATLATDHHKRMIEKHRARLQEIQNARLAGLRGLADELGRQSVTIEANANDEGHLYGSVGATDIVAALKRNEITITADQVRLRGPLKELGLYTVNIHLGHEVETDLKVWVVPMVTDELSAAGGKEPSGPKDGASEKDVKGTRAAAEAKDSRPASSP